MAIDSALKRKMAAGVPFLPLSPGVTNNSAKPIQWRFSVAWSYYPFILEIPVVDGRDINLTWELPENRFQLGWNERNRVRITYAIPDRQLTWTGVN